MWLTRSAVSRNRQGTSALALVFSLAWSLFLVFEKITLQLPWPLREFLLGQFPDEFAAQKAVVRARALSL